MRPIYFVLPIAAAFSGGGGSGETDSGAPIQQSCDAIGVCALPDEDGSLKCPDGMHKVAPPVRSEVYVLATEAGGTTYVPGELVPLTLTVTQRQILGMVDKGRGNTTLESAKYIGLLLYAVRGFDATGPLLALHLGGVLAFFLLTPYSKMAHGFYRFAALVRDAEAKAARRS